MKLKALIVESSGCSREILTNLQSVGKVLNDNCCNEDFLARFGGEEFVMLLSH